MDDKVNQNKGQYKARQNPRQVVNALMAIPRTCERIVPINPNSVTCQSIRLRNKLGLSNLRLHDLRHYNASVMPALNIPDKYTMTRGRWSTPNTMKKVYQHAFRDKQEEVDDTVNRYFDDLLDPKYGDPNE